ncbi:MAG: type IX secretion system sortase PorU, partial [Bacteroidota bacterium]
MFYLSFEGAVYDVESNVPKFYANLDVVKSNLAPQTEIINTLWEEIPSSESVLLTNSESLIPPDIQLAEKVVYENKKPLLSIKFIPIRKNSMTGKFERLRQFEIKYTYSKNGQLKIPVKSHLFAANSVLKNGDWYKFDIYQSGIHVITYNDLLTLGLDPTTIDPRNIRIYGNGGMMLPENNAAFMNDDLVENAIFVSGENDGSFNNGDYILFYAKGPNYWIADTANKVYKHQKNKYSESSTYFITASLGSGKRIQTVSSLPQSADYTVSEFDDFAFHELDSLNLIKSGREFYGEVFDVNTSYTFPFSFPNVVPSSIMKLKTNLLARSVGYSTYYRVFANSTTVINNVTIGACSSSYTGIYANQGLGEASISPNNNVNVRIDYYKGANASAKGWLDYVELNAHRYLSFVAGQMPFRNMSSIGKGVSEFVVGNTNSDVTIWNVTNFLEPQRIEVVQNGSNAQFRIRTDSLLEFVAFDATSFYSITPIGKISNQNLHGLPQTDMVIVSYPDFLGEAERIADLHRTKDHFSVLVTTPQEIFNEFSSGNQDVTAIKNFMKMFYDRAGGDVTRQPKFLLMFGDASYDCLNRLPDNTNFVPMYQTQESLDPTSSFATDDYFAFLDDFDEGAFGNLLDLSVGRLAVKTVEDAHAIVNK